MVLTVADLGRAANVTAQRYYKDRDFPSVISYEREFEDGRVGSTALLAVDSTAEIGTSAQSTARFLSTIRRLYGTKQFRTVVEKQFAQEVGDDLGLFSDLRVGRPRNLGVGSGFDLPITLRVLGLRTEIHIAAFRVERVLGALVVVGTPGERVPLSVMTRLAKIMAGRMSSALGPKNTVAPTISGTPQVGQTLTVTPGTWTGSPPTFTYRWQRCDPTGANCADIPAATGPTYVLTDSDVGATIRVVVSAQNALGTATGTSAPTAVVSALGAPTNTSLPTISGAPQVGQTLSAGTGGWTGNPTSFSFQWQRCNAGGTSCVDISGATAGTYVLGTADLGSTVRVAVTARNSIGEAAAVSAPTSVVT